MFARQSSAASGGVKGELLTRYTAKTRLAFGRGMAIFLCSRPGTRAAIT
jgi:hypothetical protein